MMNENNSQEILMTQEGLDKLKQRLEYLKTVKRYEVAERIKIAREYGDLSENSEYDEAKSEQGFVEGEISELEQQTKKVRVIKEEDIGLDSITIGNVVRYKDLSNDKEMEYKIVGSAEADLKNKHLSSESPIGKALLGAKVGETVRVKVPSGEKQLQVMGISR